MTQVTSLPSQNIQYVTEDGVNIKGTFVPPIGLKAPLIIMLHQLGRDRWTYEPYWSGLREAGFGLAAIDLRGHGQSVKAGNRDLSWEDFNKSDWQNARYDVLGLLPVITKKRGVDTGNIGIMGASIGANLALNALAGHSELKSGVLLSPGLDYRGITTIKAIKNLSEKPVMIAASKGDSYAYESAKNLSQEVGPDTLYELDGETHGTDMLKADPGLLKNIIDFFKSNLQNGK